MHTLRPIDVPKFRYNGGKANLRRFIVRWIRRHGSLYVEPFAGRGNVFFLMRILSQFEGYQLNDIRTKPFFEAILEYDGRELPDVPASTEFKDWLPDTDPVIAKIIEPLLCWSGGSYETSTKAYPAANRLLDKYRQSVLNAQKLLPNVRITSFDALDLFEQVSQDQDAVIYLDPPYLGANVSAYSEKDVDWERLWRLLRVAKCEWVMSEYQNARHDEELGPPKVRYATTVVKAGGKSMPAVEVLYGNRIPDIPCTMDFGESVRSPKSTRCLYKAGEVLTVNELYLRMPSHWHPDNRRIEFNILQKHPHCYFDGERLIFLEGFE